MRIKHVAMIFITLVAVSCQKTTIVKTIDLARLSNDNRLSFELGDDCPIEDSVNELFSEGSNTVQNWKKVLGNVAKTSFKNQFFKSWKHGERYEILDMYCIDDEKEKVSFIVDFSNKTLGKMQLGAELIEGEIDAYNLLILRDVSSE